MKAIDVPAPRKHKCQDMKIHYWILTHLATTEKIKKKKLMQSPWLQKAFY
jgi:hypothetical protein